jgi:anti-anti-sigma factor
MLHSIMVEGLSQAELDRLLRQARVERHEGQTAFTLELEYRRHCLFLVIKGRILMPIIPDDFIDRFNELVERGHGHGVAIDLRGCDYLSSGAISFIVNVFHEALNRGQQVVMLRPPDKVRKLIDILGLNQFFLIVEDEDTAVAYIAEQHRTRVEPQV